MTLLAPTLQAFFTDRLMTQRQASPNTIAAYRDTFSMLLIFVQDTTRTPPSKLRIEDLDAATIGAFLDHLQNHRGVTARTRNARLAAIHSLFKYAAIGHPEHADLIARVLAIPAKRANKALISFLTGPEINALLDAPDQATPIGRRDHILLLVAIETGLRVSELSGLRHSDVTLGTGANVACVGKGRKQRRTPLTAQTATLVDTWTGHHNSEPDTPLFRGPADKPLTRDGIARVVARHAASAETSCPSISEK